MANEGRIIQYFGQSANGEKIVTGGSAFGIACVCGC
jgi:hypothetical protein